MKTFRPYTLLLGALLAVTGFLATGASRSTTVRGERVLINPMSYQVSTVAGAADKVLVYDADQAKNGWAYANAVGSGGSTVLETTQILKDNGTNAIKSGALLTNIVINSGTITVPDNAYSVVGSADSNLGIKFVDGSPDYIRLGRGTLDPISAHIDATTQDVGVDYGSPGVDDMTMKYTIGSASAGDDIKFDFLQGSSYFWRHAYTNDGSANLDYKIMTVSGTTPTLVDTPMVIPYSTSSPVDFGRATKHDEIQLDTTAGATIRGSDSANTTIDISSDTVTIDIASSSEVVTISNAGVDLAQGSLTVQTGDIDTAGGSVGGTDYVNNGAFTGERVLYWNSGDNTLDESGVVVTDIVQISDAWYDTLSINAGSFYADNLTNGASSATVSLGTTDTGVDLWQFVDATTTNQIQVGPFIFGSGWDASSVKFKIGWTATNTVAGGTCHWGVSAKAVADTEDPGAVAWGTEVVVTDDDSTTANTWNLSESGTLTVGNTPADGDAIWLRVRRVDLGTDDLAGLADFSKIIIEYARTFETSSQF